MKNLESEQKTSGVRRRAGKERQAPEGKRKKQTKEQNDENELAKKVCLNKTQI